VPRTGLVGPLEAIRQAIHEGRPEDLPGLAAVLSALTTEATLAVAGRLAVASRNPQPALPDENLSAPEAARRLGVSLDWVYKNAKQLPSVRIGRRLLFPARGLERWNRQRVNRES
jgi:excisionase family DNA binding protein